MCGWNKKKKSQEKPTASFYDFRAMESLDSVEESVIPHIKSEAEFQSALKAAGDKLVMVDFYANWCGPCRAIAPIIETWVEEFPDVTFLKANVDKCDHALTDRYGINSIPFFVFLRNGEPVGHFLGGRYPDLKQVIISLKDGGPFPQLGAPPAGRKEPPLAAMEAKKEIDPIRLSQKKQYLKNSNTNDNNEKRKMSTNSKSKKRGSKDTGGRKAASPRKSSVGLQGKRGGK